MMVILMLIWQIIGLIAFVVYAARAGEYWTAKRRYADGLRIALRSKNRRGREMLRLSPKTMDSAVATWQNEVQNVRS